MVKSGVLQGCPLASVLFVLALEPFVCMLHSTIAGQGIIEVCADDIAVVLQSWIQLKDLYKVFQFAQSAAGLTLKPKKCVLVPLSAPLSPHLVSVLRDFLNSHSPPWAQFSITAAAKYLGIWLGPSSQVHSWNEPVTEFVNRVHTISDSHVAPSLGVCTYNMKAVPTLTYPAQFLPPPPDTTKLEKYAFVKLSSHVS
eukprot:8807284-Karenia_brevis.AAC.1